MPYLKGLAVFIVGFITVVLGGKFGDSQTSYLSAIAFSIIYLSAVIFTCTMIILKAMKNKK